MFLKNYYKNSVKKKIYWSYALPALQANLGELNIHRWIVSFPAILVSAHDCVGRPHILFSTSLAFNKF